MRKNDNSRIKVLVLFLNFLLTTTVFRKNRCSLAFFIYLIILELLGFSAVDSREKI